MVVCPGGFDDGMRLFTVGGGSSKAPKADMGGGTGWLLPSKMAGSFSAVCWYGSSCSRTALHACVESALPF